MRPRLALLLALAAVLAYACVESSSRVTTGATTSTGGPASSGQGGGSSFDRNALLAALGEQVILGTYRELAGEADALAQAADSYAASLDAEDRAALQQAWREAMAVCQRAEVMQVGPAAMMSRQIVGGQDLRDQIYSWPTVNRCRVDQEIVEGNYADVEAFKREAVNVRGLDALEYLLFYDGSDNDCAPQNNINAMGTWDAIASELPQRRADYANTLATIVAEHVRQLRDAWEPDGGNFLGALATAGQGSASFASTQEALNAVSDALFYLDRQTKDAKLAVPSGLMDCDTATCPEALESTFAGASKAHVRANLEGFQLVLLGGPPGEVALGFDDLLVSLGAVDLAAAMAADTQAAIEAVDAIEEEDLAVALEQDLDGVQALHGAVKRITDQLKSQFLSVLDLELPQSVEGDND